MWIGQLSLLLRPEYLVTFILINVIRTSARSMKVRGGQTKEFTVSIVICALVCTCSDKTYATCDVKIKDTQF